MSALIEVQRRLAECELALEDMRSYQIDELVPFLHANPRSAAYVDMGLGKTISILTLLDQLYWSGEMRKTLIVAPLRVAAQTWPTEILNWRHVRWMDGYSLIRPDPRDPMLALERARARRSDMLSPNHAAQVVQTAFFRQQMRRASQSSAPIHIINREQVAWLVKYWLDEQKRWPYDTVIIDESTSFADHTSTRWKAMARIARRCRRIHLLSGTPAPEGIRDLFAQIYLLDLGKRFGRSITAFDELYIDENKYTRKKTPKEGAVEKVTLLCADVVKIMKEEDYLPRQKALSIIRPIVLEPHQLDAYKAFEEDMVAEMEDGEMVEAVNNGVLTGKLLQWASGTLFGNVVISEETGKQTKTVHQIHSYKIDEMRQIVEEMPGEPIMVAYWFKPSLANLRRAFPKATVMDRAGTAVDDWNAGKIPMLFVHPQSAGHGLNMQKGPGRTLIFYDTPASLELHMQIIKRIDRSGQKRMVKVFYLATRGTLDALAVPKLRNKESAQDLIVEHLRRVRKLLYERRAA